MVLRHNAFLMIAIASALLLNACGTLPNKNTDKKDGERFVELLELHDLSERAFVYHQYCLEKTEPINETFMKNIAVVSDLLLNESVKTTKAPAELIVQRVVGRRKVIQQQLIEYYQSQGCQSEEARTAGAHYNAFGQMSEKQVKNLVK